MFGKRKKIVVPPLPKTKDGPPNEWMQQALSHWWLEAASHGESYPTDPSRSEYLRPSALPFCPLQEGYIRITDGVETERYRSFNENFYVDIGHAVHELVQNFVGRMEVENGVKTKVKTLGHWKCPRCNKLRTFTTYRKCSCGGKPTYREIEIRWRNTIGHIDKVLRIGKWLFILDYKTCSTWAVRSHLEAVRLKKVSKLPYISNRAQITRYVGLFEKVFAKEFEPGGKFEGCEIAGSILAYISRETVKERAFIYIPMDRKARTLQYKKAKRDDNDFAIMKTAVKKRSKKLFLKLIDSKPCSSRKFYDENYRDDFDPCPLLRVCFDCKKLNNKVMKALKDNNQ